MMINCGPFVRVKGHSSASSCPCRVEQAHLLQLCLLLAWCLPSNTRVSFHYLFPELTLCCDNRLSEGFVKRGYFLLKAGLLKAPHAERKWSFLPPLSSSIIVTGWKTDSSSVKAGLWSGIGRNDEWWLKGQGVTWEVRKAVHIQRG